jgi:hypothetical protein
MIMKRSGHQSGTAFKAVTGELYMLGKKERILLRAILAVTLKSKAGREIIAEKHGKESLQIAKTLLHEMGGRFGRFIETT